MTGPADPGSKSAASRNVHDDERDATREKRTLKPQVVRIEVLGDEKVGKTTLICSLVSRHFSEKVPSVLLNVQIPAEESNENVIISITDTSSRVSDLMRVANATKRSDAILLVYDLSRPETFQRLRRWLDLIAKHKELPVVLVANKSDINGLDPTNEGTYSNQIRHLINTYQFVVADVSCSTKNFAEVAQAFYLAQKAVLYPIEPLYNVKNKLLEPRFVKAIKRTFRLYNRDRKGLLSRDELNDFQHDCFGMPLLSGEMDTMIEFLSASKPDGVAQDGSGVLVEGFMHLWELFIQRNRPESCWQVLRSLGYTNDLRLEIPPERMAVPPLEEDQSPQLTTNATDFLEELFVRFDSNKDGQLTAEEVDDIFSICEETVAPWKNLAVISTPAQYKTAFVDGKVLLSKDAWLACWAYVAQENPSYTLETLFYLGYNDKVAPALEVTKRRSVSRSDKRIERNMVTCAIFSAGCPGKTTFVDAFLDRKSAASTASPAISDLVTAVNAVHLDKEGSRYLLLTEALLADEIDYKADVLCFLFNPLDKEAVGAVQKESAHVPDGIPRVYVAWKPDDVSQADWEMSVKNTALFVCPDESFKLCEDDTQVAGITKHLVQIALQP
ncbi:TPA: hypothetical protein N0F65_011340 [Lagenidium giganteum]|uniref:Mitochondrial Rho GTPase n=1 Tax=Lagenidium giganteum TaxID=4803 RepID=A0AAV2Z691_9STRA|nr:TPA: hypothetical protein N0F65_011340 [Lagenidium giganteum]